MKIKKTKIFETGQADPLLKEIVSYLQETDYVSPPLIQRQFSIGYARSARILDQLEELTFISPHQGAKPRKVFHEKLSLDFNLPSDIKPENKEST